MAETLRPWSLVDVSDLKNDLSISTTESEFDNILVRIANGVTDYIESYCNRFFRARSITELLDGTATTDIFLRSPIIYVTSMTDKTTVVASTNYVVYNSVGRVHLTSGVWTPEAQAIKAIYRFGYEESTLPQNVILAAMTWANFWFHAIKDDRMGLQSKSEGDLSISFRLEPIPLEVLELIKPFKAMGRIR